MSELKKIPIITEANMRGKTIGELSDRPNQTSRFGQGLTAQELKERFDAFPELIKDKINDIIKMISSKDATKYIRLPSVEESSLYDFLNLFGVKQSEEDQSIADFIYAMYALKNETEEQSHSVSEILDQIAKDIASLKAGGTTPPEDGGGDDGGTTPPDGGGDEGGDSGGTTPPEEDEEETYIEKTFTGYSLEVPEGVAENAAIVSVGSRAKVSMNILSLGNLRPVHGNTIDIYKSEFTPKFYPQPATEYEIYLQRSPNSYNVDEDVDVAILEKSEGETSYIRHVIAILKREDTEQIKVSWTSSYNCNCAYLGLTKRETNFFVRVYTPIIVPKGGEALEIGLLEPTLIEGYVGETIFDFPNEATQGKCNYLGYGYGSYLNKIDFENNKYIQNVYVASYPGQDWEKEVDDPCIFKKTYDTVKTLNGADSIYCNLFRPCKNVLTDGVGNCISATMENDMCVVRVRTREKISLADFNAYISDTFPYNLAFMIRLAEPVETDLTKELEAVDPILTVAPGGSIYLKGKKQANFHETKVRFLKVGEA